MKQITFAEIGETLGGIASRQQIRDHMRAARLMHGPLSLLIRKSELVNGEVPASSEIVAVCDEVTVTEDDGTFSHYIKRRDAPSVLTADFAEVETRTVAKLAAEHKEMLDHIKREYSDRTGGRGGRVDMWELIHRIDPEWPNPWQDPDDPEGKCTCPPIGINWTCPIHGPHHGD